MVEVLVGVVVEDVAWILFEDTVRKVIVAFVSFLSMVQKLIIQISSHSLLFNVSDCKCCRK